MISYTASATPQLRVFRTSRWPRRSSTRTSPSSKRRSRNEFVMLLVIRISIRISRPSSSHLTTSTLTKMDKCARNASKFSIRTTSRSRTWPVLTMAPRGKTNSIHCNSWSKAATGATHSRPVLSLKRSADVSSSRLRGIPTKT